MASKALFLDRDGVINIEKNYLYKIDDFEFIDGIFELCKSFLEKGYIVVVVTNQSGIARGYYTTDQFLQLTDYMEQQFYKNGITISKTYYCPHHPDITGECDCRKPKPGMLLDAAKDFNIDLSESIMIGDKQRDLEAAFRAGVLTRILFNSNEESKFATSVVDNFKKILE